MRALLIFPMILTVLSVSFMAQAQDNVTPPEPAPIAAEDDDSESPAMPTAASLKATASEAITKMGEKAKEFSDSVSIPNSLPEVLPESMGGLPQAATAAEASANFTQGQDKSITVTSDGKPESLFFTPNQLASIMRGRQGYVAPREAFEPANQSATPVTSVPHVVSLAGILYVSKNNWVIWLNGERVTRKNIPERVLGLTVRADRVHLRWMDIANQRIINITLKPRQQYLLDSDTIIPVS